MDDRETPDGYRTVKVGKTIHRAHRVIYALWHRRGMFGIVDHWNGDKQDNRPMNLRACGNRENMVNRLYWRRTFEGKLLVQLGPQPLGVVLGEFDSMDDAREYRREIVNRAVEQWYAK
ncbi:MAG: HNH endonuclease [Pseudomonadota bacterium]|nr:HNH endonuclease [Pseudomonadota bacterium]